MYISIYVYIYVYIYIIRESENERERESMVFGTYLHNGTLTRPSGYA